MPYRNRRIETYVIDFYKMLPINLRQFTLDIKKAISALSYCAVVSYQEFAETRNISVDEVKKQCESDDGCTYKKKNNYLIMYNDSPDISEARKSFTLAHELGHIVLGHVRILESFGINKSSYSNQLFKRQADYFAACLICPVPILSRLKPKSILSIQGVFGFSAEAAKIAFKDYKNYDKYYHIKWHNDILKLFDFQTDLLKIYSDELDSVYESEEYKPKSRQRPKAPESQYRTYLGEQEMKKMRRKFEKLEDDWLYPEALGL